MKGLIAFLLCVLLLIGSGTVAFAADAPGTDIPTIYVLGAGSGLVVREPAPEQLSGDQAHDRFLAILDEIRARRRMIVLVLAHCKVERFEDPENQSYDRYSPRLQKLAGALLCEWADAVLFATQRMRVDSATGKAAPIGAGGGQRVLRCIGGPACVAKNRFDLPAEIELSWQAFVDNIGKGASRG